jgi:hypothetical protein
MKYEIPEQTQKNLLLFLDRVETKGLVENQAYQEIVYILNHPIQENPEEQKGDGSYEFK